MYGHNMFFYHEAHEEKLFFNSNLRALRDLRGEFSLAILTDSKSTICDRVRKGCIPVKRIFFILIINALFFVLAANPLHSCVGRLLIVAVSDSTDQVIIGQMLSVLINERTGTTVNIVQPGDLMACHEEVLKGKADIYINYIGEARARTEISSDVDDPQEAYILVSQFYMEKYSMVWLKPFGYQGPLTSEANPGKHGVTLAVPIAAKDTLRKFPVLDRLINKLRGRIDNNTMDELMEKTKNRDAREVVKEFLKTQRLI